MSTVGAKLRERYGIERTRIVVPLWSGVLEADSHGQPAIYAAPFTEEDAADLAAFIGEDSPEGFAEVLIRCALDESGARLFDRGDKQTLMSAVESHELRRIATGIMIGDASGVPPPGEDLSADVEPGADDH